MVEQPFGQFVITSLPARILLDTAYSDRLAATRMPDGSYRLTGSQRELAKPRLKEIGKFIDSGAASFPNSIILAANYAEETGMEVEDVDQSWEFKPSARDGCGSLRIPVAAKTAAIIDGQHRLFGFNYAEKPHRLDMPLVCSVFFDLPKPYQARLFATINANQRPVNKSQTYELFGYNLEEEPAKKWTPEKLAVFMARKLNAEKTSPFHDHIVVPAENDFSTTLAAARRDGNWAVSLATVVEGTLRLITSNPKHDAFKMAGELRYEGHDRLAIDPAADPRQTPLREVYRECNDEIIYTAINNFFAAVDKTLWQDVSFGSFICKTVGVQALFDISRPLLFEAVQARDLRVPRFAEQLAPARKVNFSDPFFHASGACRTTIRKIIEYATGRSEPSKAEVHYKEFCRLLGK